MGDYLLPFMVFTGGLTGGIDDGINGNKLRKGICDTNKKISDVSDQYKKILGAQSEQLNDLKTEFLADLANLSSLKDTLQDLRANWIKTRTQMIIASVLFVTSILVAFIFKEFDVFQNIYKAIFGSGGVTTGK